MCECFELSDWVDACKARGAWMKRQLDMQGGRVFKSDVGREAAGAARL